MKIHLSNSGAMFLIIRCVSPVLCALDLQFCSKTWDNMTVRVRPTAREVIATYKLNEEGSMELVMQLPANYPLGNILVETGRKVGVTSNQWRSWILQLQTFLMQQVIFLKLVYLQFLCFSFFFRLKIILYFALSSERFNFGRSYIMETKCR